MIRHEDDWLLGNCSVLVGRQNGVTALDLLDGSGFTRRTFALDNLHECARYEAVAAACSICWVIIFILPLPSFLFLFLFLSEIFSFFLFVLPGIARAWAFR